MYMNQQKKVSLSSATLHNFQLIFLYFCRPHVDRVIESGIFFLLGGKHCLKESEYQTWIFQVALDDWAIASIYLSIVINTAIQYHHLQPPR